MRHFGTEPLTPSMIDPGALAARLQSLAESEARTTALPAGALSEIGWRVRIPVAGPHADPRLMDPDRTPGTGMLPPIGLAADPNMQPTG